MCAFGGLYEEAKSASFSIGSDCCVAGVCERAGLTVTKAGEVVFVAAERLLFAAESVDNYVKTNALDGNAKIDTTYFSLNEQNCWFMTCHTISSEDIFNGDREKGRRGSEVGGRLEGWQSDDEPKF